MQIAEIVRGMVPANDPRSGRVVRLAVVQVDRTWRIFVNEQKVGRFSRHADAIRCALEIASETRRDGYPVEVLSQGAFGEVSAVLPELTNVQ